MRVQIEQPKTPNYLRLSYLNNREDNITTIPIESFTDEDLAEVGRLWTEQLISIAQRKRNNLDVKEKQIMSPLSEKKLTKIETIIHSKNNHRFTVASVFDIDFKLMAFGVSIPNYEKGDIFLRKVGSQKALGIAKSKHPVFIHPISINGEDATKQAFTLTKYVVDQMDSDKKYFHLIQDKLHLLAVYHKVENNKELSSENEKILSATGNRKKLQDNEL